MLSRVTRFYLFRINIYKKIKILPSNLRTRFLRRVASIVLADCTRSSLKISRKKLIFWIPSSDTVTRDAATFNEARLRKYVFRWNKVSNYPSVNGVLHSRRVVDPTFDNGPE